MPSIIPGYVYDIFISYRQKDNKYDGWVTEFVNHLKDELEATFKEDISIYFDENPHDGLLETHDVDQSLNEKVKALIFIPIISQTYCDPKCFAWQNEFLPFLKFASKDEHGLDIKLSHGNVAKRVLPIKIHEIEDGDKQIFEKEVGGVMRSVDFIYREPGVNRPLRVSEENPSNNLNNTTYRNQVNKVANAIKEVIYGFQNKTIQNISQVKEKIESSAENSIAVLPFVNISNDLEQDYFCDGISEEIINALAQINNLRVIARTSVFSFKGKNLDVRKIGETLDVSTLLEGSVRKAGNQLRITTKLVRVSDGSHLWSNRYDRELEDIFSIQDDIAKNVAIELKGFLTNEEKEVIRPQETVIEAYEYFLRGRQFFHQLALDKSKQMFEKAIEFDPGYAPAYAGLSDVHSWLYEWGGGSDSNLVKAENYSKKALSLAPNTAESHSSYGFVLSLGKRYDESEKEFNEAIRLNPNSFAAYYYYGRSCFARGQIDKSAKLFRQASEVRREDFQSVLLLAQSLRILGKDQPDEIVRDGINRARKQLELDPTDRRALSLGSANLLSIGEREEALKWINKALKLYPKDQAVLGNAACLFAIDGNKEKALSILELIWGKGHGKREWIEHDPDYDSLRNEPRFKALLNKLK